MKMILALAASVVGLVGFQMPDMNPFSMQADPIMVLGRGEVQKELKLTKDQKREINELSKHMAGDSKLNPNDPSSGMDAMSHYKESSEKAVALLDDDQKTRLSQIRYQMLGPVCLSTPEVQKQLALTDAQNEQVSKIRSDGMSEMMDIMQHVGSGRGVQGKLDDLSKREADKLTAILTDEQKTKLTALYGPVFKKARPPQYFPI